MPRKSSIGAIKVADGQTSGTKRAANDRGVNPRKRPKQSTGPNVFNQLHLDQVEGQQDIVKEDHTIFPFLELPGELRNRIYEMAADYSYRCFPPTCPKPKPPKGSQSKRSPSTPDSTSDNPLRSTFNKPIPYLALTQVCSQIRTEFRPMWLCTHRFPLFALDPYLKTFFPRPKPTTDRKRFDSYFDPEGTLRLYIRPDDLLQTDILKLLKHKTRFPSYNLNAVSNGSPSITVMDLASLSALIENTNPKWKKWVKSNVLTQVRFCRSPAVRQVRLVVKENFAPGWMRPTLNASGRIPAGYLETLGLGLGVEENPGVKFCFGVDYS